MGVGVHVEGAHRPHVPPGACDPATLARDLGRFRRAGWHVQSVRAFDMYPNTHHVETLAVLEP